MGFLGLFGNETFTEARYNKAKERNKKLAEQIKWGVKIIPIESDNLLKEAQLNTIEKGLDIGKEAARGYTEAFNTDFEKHKQTAYNRGKSSYGAIRKAIGGKK
jgi:hypothetical protein